MDRPESDGATGGPWHSGAVTQAGGAGGKDTRRQDHAKGGRDTAADTGVAASGSSQSGARGGQHPRRKSAAKLRQSGESGDAQNEKGSRRQPLTRTTTLHLSCSITCGGTLMI